MPNPSIQIFPLQGLPDIGTGDELGLLIADAARRAGFAFSNGDVLVVAQKIVSKAEGSVVRLAEVIPSDKARAWARKWDKDARVVELVLREAKSILRMECGVIIAETRHGFICANAGVDVSNAAEGTAVLLPDNPDASALGIRETINKELGVSVAVIVSDTFGRAWREGLVNVALGVSGMKALRDERGLPDMNGRRLESTIVALADEIAAAAGLAMFKAARVPVVILRGIRIDAGEGSGRDLLRAKERDLFR